MYKQILCNLVETILDYFRYIVVCEYKYEEFWVLERTSQITYYVSTSIKFQCFHFSSILHDSWYILRNRIYIYFYSICPQYEQELSHQTITKLLN